MNKLVAFRDTLEENADVHYGILTNDNTIICLCCLMPIKDGNYEIIEEDIDMGNTSIDTLLCEELYDYNAMDDCKRGDE